MSDLEPKPFQPSPVLSFDSGFKNFDLLRSVSNNAALISNEVASESFTDEMQARHPDGYLVGVGCGAVFEMLRFFENPPRGIVLIDSDPTIAALCLMVRDTAFESRDDQSLISSLFRTPINSNAARALPFARQVAKAGNFRVSSQDLQMTFQAIFERVHNVQSDRRINVAEAFTRNYKFLKDVIHRNAVHVIHGDFTDPDVVARTTAMPYFGDNHNLIYLSNIAGHIPDPVKAFKNLSPYQSPSKTTFVDARAEEFVGLFSLHASPTLPSAPDSGNF